MKSAIKYSLPVLLLCTSFVTHVFAGGNRHDSSNIHYSEYRGHEYNNQYPGEHRRHHGHNEHRHNKHKHHNKHHGHHKHRHNNHYVEHRYVEHRYVQPQPYVVREVYHQPQVHYHNNHCGHRVTTHERVVYRDDYFPVRHEPVRHEEGFGLESVTIRLR